MGEIVNFTKMQTMKKERDSLLRQIEQLLLRGGIAQDR